VCGPGLHSVAWPAKLVAVSWNGPAPAYRLTSACQVPSSGAAISQLSKSPLPVLAQSYASRSGGAPARR